MSSPPRWRQLWNPGQTAPCASVCPKVILGWSGLLACLFGGRRFRNFGVLVLICCSGRGSSLSPARLPRLTFYSVLRTLCSYTDDAHSLSTFAARPATQNFPFRWIRTGDPPSGSVGLGLFLTARNGPGPPQVCCLSLSRRLFPLPLYSSGSTPNGLPNRRYRNLLLRNVARMRVDSRSRARPWLAFLWHALKHEHILPTMSTTLGKGEMMDPLPEPAKYGLDCVACPPVVEGGIRSSKATKDSTPSAPASPDQDKPYAAPSHYDQRGLLCSSVPFFSFSPGVSACRWPAILGLARR